MIGRRSLLRLISAAPLAASSTRAMDLAGLRTAGLGTYVGSVGTGSIGPGQTGSTNAEPDYVRGASYLLANGIPAFAKEALRRQQRTPSGLDPDLATNRSFSLAAKVQLQRDRDFDRAVENTMVQQKTSLSRYALSKALGFELYW